MYCPECGSNIPEDSIFCENCGARIEPAAGFEKTAVPKKKKRPRKKPIYARLPFWVAVAVLAVAVWGVFKVKSVRGGGEVIQTPKYEIRPESSAAPSSPAPAEAAEEPAKAPESVSVPSAGEQAPAVFQPQTDENGLVSISTEEAAEGIEALLSTTEYAKALDFEWFLDCELSNGFEAGLVICNPGAVNGVQGDEAAFLNGGWKAFQADTLTKPYAPYIERYYNMTIDTDGERFNATANWKYMYFPGEGQSKEESGSDLFEGTWDAESCTATCRSDYGTIVFEHFFIAPDSSAEYATGTFYWISGETERIALMRTAE